jgi:hypothetical protein
MLRDRMKLLQRTRMKQGQRGARRGETGLFHPALASAFPQWGLCNGDCAHVRRGGRGEAAQRSVEVLGRRTYKGSRRSPRAAGESEQSELRLNRVPRSRSASFERAQSQHEPKFSELCLYPPVQSAARCAFASRYQENRLSVPVGLGDRWAGPPQNSRRPLIARYAGCR